ncbi:WXG100 family type VII secretion target [Glycomyces tarimensis]
MPSYQEVLDADPAEFESCADEFERAANELSSGRERYRTHIDSTGAAWAGDDHKRVRDQATGLEDQVTELERSLGVRAAILRTLGPVLGAAVEALQQTDQELRDAGYTVEPGPEVTAPPAPVVRGPFGPALESLDDLTAETATVLLTMMHRAVVVMDEALADAIETGELPPGRAQSFLDEWGDIGRAAEAMRGRLIHTGPWDLPDGPVHQGPPRSLTAPSTTLTNPWATEAALRVAARFAARG